MNPPANARAAWREFREALCLGEPRARLRLLATVTSLVSHAARSLEPETRAKASERIAAVLDARIRTQAIRSPADLVHALDRELARWIPGEAHATSLLPRLGAALAALPEVQRQALSRYYGSSAAPGPGDIGARREALAELRSHLALDAP